MKDSNLVAEVKRRIKDGFQPVTIQSIQRKLAALGYKLDRSMDARCNAVYQSGKYAGMSHPCLTTGIREADTNLSAFNVNARRDDSFKALQALRGTVYAVVRGYIFEL